MSDQLTYAKAMKMKVGQLREELENRKLDTSGLKKKSLSKDY